MTDTLKKGDTHVYKKPKQPTYCFRLEEKLAKKLDRRIERTGYHSRSDFFTAVAYVALYGDKTKNQPQTGADFQPLEKLPQTTSLWIKNTMPRISEEEIQSELHAVIEEMLTPVIAMKGVDIAYENTWEDVRKAFHEKTNIWTTESDIREAYTSFALVNRAKLLAYRQNQLQQPQEE